MTLDPYWTSNILIKSSFCTESAMRRFPTYKCKLTMVDAKCGGCTEMVDLQVGGWWVFVSYNKFLTVGKNCGQRIENYELLSFRSLDELGHLITSLGRIWKCNISWIFTLFLAMCDILWRLSDCRFRIWNISRNWSISFLFLWFL